MGCDLWGKGQTGSGYGAAYINGKQILAHRLSYKLSTGIDPKGFVVCHRCDNKLCINPDHLFLGTQKDNIRDMFNKKRQHDRRGCNGNHSKLEDKDVYEIKDLIKFGYTYNHIGEMYNVSLGAIADIGCGRAWAHI